MSTIKDVARSAGVSTATVSRVLNKKGAVSPEAEKAVNRAMRQLDYYPNRMARALVPPSVIITTNNGLCEKVITQGASSPPVPSPT